MPAHDVILHCKSEQQARVVLDAIVERLAQVGLELNPDKTRIVYCKDAERTGSHEHERFDFLGYTFRPRLARSRSGGFFVSFCPAVADDAAKAIGRTIKRWRLHLWSGLTIAHLAQAINPIVRGWINYYGRFYRSRLLSLLSERIEAYLVRWAMKKYKRLRGHPQRGATAAGQRPTTRTGALRPLADRSAAHGRMTEPGEPRGSRRDLREPGGATPPGHSTWACASR